MKIVSVNTIRANALHEGMVFSFALIEGEPIKTSCISVEGGVACVGVYIDKDFNAVGIPFDSEYHKLFLRRFGT